jgi:hypothetical protein
MRTLKILSSEMDPAEIRFIQKAFIKERGAEIFRKILPSPTLCEPFKILSHRVQLLAIRQRISNTGMKQDGGFLERDAGNVGYHHLVLSCS